MNLLALDTATPVCAVALRAGERTFEYTVHAGNTHSQLALPMIESMLSAAGIGYADLDAVGFGSGPGSFTGVRIGCALAQGIAFAHQKPVAPVSTLLALAYACDAPRVWVVNDARMNEVYCAAYAKDLNGTYRVVAEPRVCAPEAALPDREAWALAGDGWAQYAPLQNFAPHIHTSTLTASGLIAACVAAFRAGCTLHPRDAQPLYVRDKVALTEAERAALKAV